MTLPPATTSGRDVSRRAIYYWKSDRPAAVASSPGLAIPREEMQTALRQFLTPHFPDADMEPGGGQGNHRTFVMTSDERKYFVRVEDGPEGDRHFEIEALLLQRVQEAGVRVPAIHFTDSTRRSVPFSVQVSDFFTDPDLNSWNKRGKGNLDWLAGEIGKNVARWQLVGVSGFGHFETAAAVEGRLEACHPTYAGYFLLNLERHLEYLEMSGFLGSSEVKKIRGLIADHAGLLEVHRGCLVHKDLALWNILGTPERITAFIDWDDAVSGDPMDDLSLLGCFHDGNFLRSALSGYTMVRSLPENHTGRFWLHLLRNMLVKAVIRVRGGYFEKTETFFLIGAGATGTDLKHFTIERIRRAMQGLATDAAITDL